MIGKAIDPDAVLRPEQGYRDTLTSPALRISPVNPLRLALPAIAQHQGD
jgi:hypothetical protein